MQPCTITFIEEYTKVIYYPHDDAHVVTMIVANHTENFILVNTDSSADTIQYLAEIT